MGWAAHPQAWPDGRLRHLLTLDGMPRRHLEALLQAAAGHLDRRDAPGGNPGEEKSDFEPHHAGGVVSIAADTPPDRLVDTLTAAADARYVVLTYPENGAPFLLAVHCAAHQHIVNAGDGSYANPVQALCNVLTIQRRFPELTERRIAIVGDVDRSGSARSTLHALTTLGTPEIRIVGPQALTAEAIGHLGASWYPDRESGLAGMDAVIALAADEDRAAGAADVVRFPGATSEGPGTAMAVEGDVVSSADGIRAAVWQAVLAVLAASRPVSLPPGAGHDAKVQHQERAS